MSQGMVGQKSPRFNDLTGMRFERLVVQGYAGLTTSKRPRSLWKCLCDCGREKLASTQSLRAGQSRSCGCLTREINAKIHTTHGLSSAAEYQCWANAIQRCTNAKSKDFHLYGGRGIAVCDRWLNSFENFIADMGPRPEDCNSLDRFPNQNGNYEPGNCRWATPAMQGVNTGRNVFYEHDGKRLCLSAWARETGIKRATLEGRIRRGQSFAMAIGKPVL